MSKATIKAMNNLNKTISATAERLTALKAEYAKLRLQYIQTVTTTKVGETITLASGNRVIKAKKNKHGRYKVTEGRKTLVSEYMGGGIHDLRFDIAMGAI